MLVSDKAMSEWALKHSQLWILNAVKTLAEKMLIFGDLALAGLILLRGSQ